jgi:small subunit ribosomal protein S8
MTMQDPIADMIIRIKNAQSVNNGSVSMPSSKLKVEIAKILQEEGYVEGFEVVGDSVKPTLSITLKYFNGKPVISSIKRVSKPSLRVYRGTAHLPRILGGLGVAIVSTSRGLMTEKKARSVGEGGEIICYVE